MPWTPPSASARVVWPTMDDLRAVPSAPLTVAAGQAACTALDISANVAAAAGLVRRAADQGAALLVLPELFLTGYELPAILADPQTYTLSPADLRLDPLATACAQTRTAVVVGAPTRDPQSGGLHISALVLGRDGRFAVQYDKQHVDPAERAAGFSPGASGCTLTLDGWRLGLGICWDSSYPEHARAAALDGCHAYLVGAMFGRGRGAHRRHGLPGAGTGQRQLRRGRQPQRAQRPVPRRWPQCRLEPGRHLARRRGYRRPRPGHRPSGSGGPGACTGRGSGTGRCPHAAPRSALAAASPSTETTEAGTMDDRTGPTSAATPVRAVTQSAAVERPSRRQGRGAPGDNRMVPHQFVDHARGDAAVLQPRRGGVDCSWR